RSDLQRQATPDSDPDRRRAGPEADRPRLTRCPTSQGPRGRDAGTGLKAVVPHPTPWAWNAGTNGLSYCAQLILPFQPALLILSQLIPARMALLLSVGQDFSASSPSNAPWRDCFTNALPWYVVTATWPRIWRGRTHFLSPFADSFRFSSGIIR